MTQLDVERDRQARIDLIKTYWDALMAADMEAFRSLLAPDAVIHYPGQNYLSGDYKTTDDIVELYRKLSQVHHRRLLQGRGARHHRRARSTRP